jgi:hypothetical protein
MFWLLQSLAVAGELIVTTATPVIVKVDGTALDYVPGTMVVQVSGMSGIHKVEITSMSGQVLQSMNVNVPLQGGAGLAFDGRNLVLAAAGQTGGVGAVVGGPVAAPAPAPAAPVPMDAATFTSLTKTVQSSAFGDDKVSAVRTAAAGNWFTIDQVGRLVDLASFGDDKVGIVAACRGKIVDPENAFQLGTHFSFSSDREKALAMFQ